MVKVYVALILKGKKTIDQVPTTIREAVIAELAKQSSEGN